MMNICDLNLDWVTITIVSIIVIVILIVAFNASIRNNLCEFRRTLLERFDRTISGRISKQLSWYISIVVGLMIIFIVIALLLNNYTVYDKSDDWGKIRGILSHFIDPGNLMVETSISMQLFTGFVAIIGMVLFSGLLITTLTNSVERRVDSIEQGRIVYHNMKDHYVIIGYGEIIVSLIEDLFRHHYESTFHKSYDSFKKLADSDKRKIIKSFPKIIILTSQDIPTVRANIYSYFSIIIETRLIFYSGNIESMEHLSNLNINTAKEVYVLGEMNEYGRDTKNLESVRKISELRGVNKDLLNVHVQFDRLTSYSTIQKLSLPDDYTRSSINNSINIFFRPFNFYENSARLLWGSSGIETVSDNLDYEMMEGDKYVHLVIVGFNRMGRALMFEALRLCHYPNYVEEKKSEGIRAKNRTKITIVDKELDDQLPAFLAEFPYLDQITDVEIEYKNSRVEDQDIREMITTESENKNALLTIAICLQDPDYSMSAGLSLPNAVYYKIVNGKPENSDTRVLIRQELQEGIGRVLENNKDRYKHVHTFGMLTSGITRKLLCDKLSMCVSAYYDVKYIEYEENNGKKAIVNVYSEYTNALIEKEPLLKDRTYTDWVCSMEHTDFMLSIAKQLWLLQSEDFRFANRYQIDMYDTYLKYADSPMLSQMEHLRWNADRSIIGYRDMSKEGIKNTDYQLHKLIIPFNALDIKTLKKKEIEKDEDVIKNMHKLLRFFHE